jgi:predicted AlkP superfamily pyrophosphatase or phosphodiesterase
MLGRVLPLLLALPAVVPACGPEAPVPTTVLLVSVDGMRHDDLDVVPLPNFGRLLAGGVRAPLVPIFPTKTFPNHYSMVTGLYAEQHGVVANTMYDPDLDAWFRLSDRRAVADGRWWGGEPIWVTAERHGIRTAPLFWPGVEAEIGGIRPTYWLPFDDRMPNERRVTQVLEWLDLRESERPRFITTYFSTVDVAGHNHGPGSAEVKAALRDVDRLIGLLLDGLAARGMLDATAVLVVSDHGRAERSPEQVVILDDLLSPGLAEVVDWSPVLQLRPVPGMTDSVYRLLAGRHPHLQVYRKADIPERWHYRANSRIQPIVAVADQGWEISSREWRDRRPDAFSGASHGWDPDSPDMWGVFVASGPWFRAGYEGAPFRNVHLYELLCRLLDVPPAPNAGSPDSTAQFLRRHAR